MAERCVFTIRGFEWVADLRRIGPFRSQLTVYRTPGLRTIAKTRRRHKRARLNYERILAVFAEEAKSHPDQAPELLTFTYDPFLGEHLRGDP